jgi:hypothetical protein
MNRYIPDHLGPALIPDGFKLIRPLHSGYILDFSYAGRLSDA